MSLVWFRHHSTMSATVAARDRVKSSISSSSATSTRLSQVRRVCSLRVLSALSAALSSSDSACVSLSDSFRRVSESSEGTALTLLTGLLVTSGSVSLNQHLESSSSSLLDVVPLERRTTPTDSGYSLIGHPELSFSSSLDKISLDSGATLSAMIHFVGSFSMALPDSWSTIGKAPSICMSSAKRRVSI